MSKNLKDFKTVKSIVEYALQKYPELRDSDKAHTVKIRKYLAGSDTIDLSKIYDLPSQDDIKRIWAWFNQKGMYKSTNPEVLRRRQGRTEEVREALGYNNNGWE